MKASRRLILRKLRNLSALGLLGAVSPIELIRQALAAGNKPVAPGMHKLKGEVRINGQDARQGQLVGPGDTVSTGHGAEAIYVIGQEAFLQRENSVVRFGKDAVQDFFRVVSGKLLSVFGPGEKKLLTPTATIGIRGTGCYIEAEEKRVYFCLCYGTADVVPLADPSRAERIVTEHHDHPIIVNAETGIPSMVGAEVINHSDAELTLLENLTGRWPPFYGRYDSGYR
jgi:hypothetical protein